MTPEQLREISFEEMIKNQNEILETQEGGFYPTKENPCVMMKENHKTKSCEYIIIYQDELYNASSILKEILHIVQDKYKI